MVNLIPVQCKELETTLRNLNFQLRQFQAELHGGSRAKADIIDDIMEVLDEISLTEASLNTCISQNPPPPPPLSPDLVAKLFRVVILGAQKRVRFSAVIKNEGNKDISGPIDLVMGAEYSKRGVLFSIQQVVHVPSNVTLVANGAEYTTDYLETDLVYRNQDSGAKYSLEVIIDPEQHIPEINRTNNHFQMTWWTVSRP